MRNSKRYTTIDTRKDGIRFNNSTLRQLNEQFQSFRETYNDVQSKLANEVIKVAGTSISGNALKVRFFYLSINFFYISPGK